MVWLGRVLDRGLPAWLVLLSLAAYSWPWRDADPFASSRPYLPYLFCLAMFAIGGLLPRSEVSDTLRRWPTVLFGTAVQYVSMPLLAFAMCVAFDLPPELRIGVIIAGCMPDAMGSSVVTLLARGNVSYAVSLTTASTIVSPVVAPAAMSLLLVDVLEFDAWKAAFDLLWQVVGPVVLGHLLSRAVPTFERAMRVIGPILANVTILWIVAVVVALNRPSLGATPVVLLAALLGLNLLGYVAGYLSGRVARLPTGMVRALTLCVGMQNAGLGTVMASQQFPDRPEIMIPTALYTFGCMLTGTILAWIWSQSPSDVKDQPSDPDAAPLI